MLYGCEAWSLTLREESRLRVFENRILGRVFESKRDENGELHCLYRSLNIVRVIKSRRLTWAGHVARMEGGRSSFSILTGTLQEINFYEGLNVDGRTILEWILKE